MKNNLEQDKAIKTIDKNLSVIAGAGTGKTKVLTERFVYILENGDLPRSREVESIVAITFTKKASQEMIERIRGEIRKNFYRGGEWRRYYRDIEKANISTIHSFCLNILKENVIDADLDPMFEVIEDYQSKKMLRDSIIEALETQLEEDPNTYKLLKMMKLDRTKLLLDDINSIYSQIRTIGISIGYIEELTIRHLESLKPIDPDDLIRIRKLVYTLIEKGTKSAKIRKVLDDKECISFLNEEEVDNLPRVLTFIEENIGTNKKQEENIALLVEYIERVLLSLERENIIHYKTLFKILEKLDASYKDKKDVFGGLDYEDLQIKTNELLSNKSILAKYQDRYRYIMIDEFQDTNELQKQIFYKICTVEKELDRENLFIVGDPKQSIYGFRGADLDVFYDVADYINSTNGGSEVNLNKNYRSVNTVVEFVNNIFSKIMGRDYSPLSSDKKSKQRIDIELISDEELAIPHGVRPSEYEKNFEAEEIAKRIRQLVDNGEYRYRDFAMLFRATTRNHIYERALNKCGVPYYNIGSKGFFKQQEVLDLINALKSINNIRDKVATIGFLRSNLIGLDDNTIYHIFKDPDLDIYRSMEVLIEEEKVDETQIAGLNQAIEIYREMSVYKDVYSLNQILSKLLNKTLYIQTSLLKKNARQKFANIQKFVDILRQYEEKQTGNLKDFLDYIDDIIGNDESLGQIESDNTDALKMLTIHKSKGLEFPVVIIPEMASRGYSGSSRFLIGENGVAINFLKSNPIYNKIKKDQEEKDKEEMKRVLYVAMTRAEERIILGNQGKKTGFKGMIVDILSEEEYKSLGSIVVEEDKSESVQLVPEEIIDEEAKSLSIEDREELRKKLPILYSIDDYDKGFKSRVSISKYMIFRDCRRKYFLQENISASHIEDINEKEDMDIEGALENKRVNRHTGKDGHEQKEDILDPIQRGIVVHEFCELYRHGKDTRRLIKDILHKEGINYREDIYLSIEKYIENYLKHYSEDMDEIYYEKPFFLQLDKAYISGYIDKMTITDGKISIIDFKTNKIYNKAKLVREYSPQIQLYAYVASKNLNLPIENATILFLENGEKVNIEVNQKSLAKNIEDIQAFINFTLKNNKIDQYEKEENCSEYCEYRGICKL